ncbi:MAG: hypothetical protein ABR549_15355 [Mycobacteriales bacterium]
MEEQQRRRPRRLRAPRSPRTPLVHESVSTQGRESAQSVLPDVPRVGALDALLREIDGLRLTLETDLTLAAAAVESGVPQVAADIIDSDRDGLRSFEQRALAQLSELAHPKRRFRVPVAPFIAAAAVAGFVLGVVPHTGAQTSNDATNVSSSSATETLHQLTTAASNGETAEAIQAANKMHAQLLAVVAQAGTDPVAAQQALALLRAEQFVLANTGTSSAALTQALAASRQLTSRILLVLTTAKPAPHRTSTVVVVPSSRPAPSSSPKPTSSPKPKPTSSPQPRRTSSPNASASPSSGSGLPGAPGFS